MEIGRMQWMRLISYSVTLEISMGINRSILVS